MGRVGAKASDRLCSRQQMAGRGSYMEMAIWSGKEAGIWGHEAGPHFSVLAIEGLVARKKKKE